MITHVPTIKPHDIKHPLTPWYVVSLEVPAKNKHYLTPLQRYTVAVESPAALAEAHRELSEIAAKNSASHRWSAIRETLYGESFLVSDLNRNWWEIACLRN